MKHESKTQRMENPFSHANVHWQAEQLQRATFDYVIDTGQEAQVEDMPRLSGKYTEDGAPLSH